MFYVAGCFVFLLVQGVGLWSFHFHLSCQILKGWFALCQLIVCLNCASRHIKKCIPQKWALGVDMT